MNSYTKPLAAPSVQTLLPAVIEDGRVVGWYPIASTTFDGTEVTFVLADAVSVPLKVVTVDSNAGTTQYMAAVWPTGLAHDYQPWASSQLVSVADGNFRIWNQTTQGSSVREGGGVLVTALSRGMDQTITNHETSLTPNVNPAVALSWQASIKYLMLTGGCTFFDFNWVSLISDTLAVGIQALRIEVVSNPAPIGTDTQSPLLAKVVGVPTVTTGGTVYDTIRILKNRDDVPAGAYAFDFLVYNTGGYSTAVTLTLTVS